MGEHRLVNPAGEPILKPNEQEEVARVQLMLAEHGKLLEGRPDTDVLLVGINICIAYMSTGDYNGLSQRFQILMNNLQQACQQAAGVMELNHKVRLGLDAANPQGKPS